MSAWAAIDDPHGMAAVLKAHRLSGTIVAVFGVTPNRLFTIETMTGGAIVAAECACEPSSPARVVVPNGQTVTVTAEQLARMIVAKPDIAAGLKPSSILVLARALLAECERQDRETVPGGA